MLRVLIASALVGVIFAQQTCTQQPVGDEVVEQAIPVAEHFTAGKNLVRDSWCIAHCKEGISIIATMRFKPSSKTSATYNVTRHHRADGHIETKKTLVKGTPRAVPKTDVKKPHRRDIDDSFCVDSQISATVAAVLDAYNTTETIAEALNYYINKPNWAYLVFLMGPPPSIIATTNVFEDPDFCMITSFTENGNDFIEIQIFAGVINDDNTMGKLLKKH